jgi:hypothetical protein
MPLPKRLATLLLRAYAVLPYLSIGYPSLWGRYKLVTHPFATDQEMTQKEECGWILLFVEKTIYSAFCVISITVRLACVRRTASVHPEL